VGHWSQWSDHNGDKVRPSRGERLQKQKGEGAGLDSKGFASELGDTGSRAFPKKGRGAEGGTAEKFTFVGDETERGGHY